MVLETYMKICVTAGFSRKKIFASKIRKMDQKWTKKEFFEFIEKFGH